MHIIDLNHSPIFGWKNPTALVIYNTHALNPQWATAIRAIYPDITIVGMSSCHGVLHPDGFLRGAYGVVFEEADGVRMRAMLVDLSQARDIRMHVSRRVSAWREDTEGNPLFFIHATQGTEESVIRGIQDVFTDDAEIFGATPGNDAFLPEGYVILNEESLTCGVLIIQLQNTPIVARMSSGGYLPTQRHGTITEAHGRVIEAIDGRPAVDVYDEWTDGVFSSYLQRGGELPKSSVLKPFGRALAGEPGDDFWLIHPWFVDNHAGALHGFAEVEEGTNVCLMRSDEAAMTQYVETAIGKVLAHVDRNKIRFAFIIYCAGCVSVLANDMDKICQLAQSAFGDIPYLGCSSCGEQGRLDSGSRAYHGNMMIGIVLLMGK